MSSLLGLAAIPAGLLLIAAVFSDLVIIQHSRGTLRLGVRRGFSPNSRIVGETSVDIAEGFSTHFLLLLLAWITIGMVTASLWVPRIPVLTPLTLSGMVICIILVKASPRATTYWLAVEVVGVAALFIATASHTPAGLGPDFTNWVLSVHHNLDLGLLVVMAGAAWLGAAWTVFCVVWWRNVPLGLAPMAVVVATEVINDPSQREAPFLVSLWLLLAGILLLRLTAARLARRWSMSEQLSLSLGVQGMRALVALLVAALLIPPLSGVDLSAKLFAGQGRRATGGGPGTGSPGQHNQAPSFVQTGYTEKVEPGGTLVRSNAPVMRVISDFPRTVYWRGIDLYAVDSGAWEVGNPVTVSAEAAPNQPVSIDPYGARRTVHASVTVLAAQQNSIFWPGEPLRVNVPVQLRGDRASFNTGPPAPATPATSAVTNDVVRLTSVDGAYSPIPLAAGTTYIVEATYSVATEKQLRAAGTDYPSSVQRLTHRVGEGRLRAPIDTRIADLARQLAGPEPNVYEKVKAIESYLRLTQKYQLQITPPPASGDPVTYFLFTSHVGYCEYFASAMGEMLRSLGIPVRLAQGYGPGVTASQQDRDRFVKDLPGEHSVSTIRAADAHTWVEVFFPGYGWVPFEPTPDPNYPELDRSPLEAASRTAPNPVAPLFPARHPRAQSPPPVLLGPRALVPLGLAALIVLVLLAARAARGPTRLKRLDPAWRRVGWLGARIGIARRDSDTPLEYTDRLAAALPQLSAEVRQLGWAQSRAVYSRAGLGAGELARAEAAWSRTRAWIVRLLVFGRGGAGSSTSLMGSAGLFPGPRP